MTFGAFGDIPVTQKGSLIRFDMYYYVHFPSFGPLSGLSEILFFTWEIWRCGRDIPSALGCGVSWLHATCWESCSSARGCQIYPMSKKTCQTKESWKKLPLTISDTRERTFPDTRVAGLTRARYACGGGMEASF